ncbi:RING finger domain-containing protein [Mycena venus]|uniref:RING finger domain-containing protein n=1 Tax=Mycena venus TaxID=2733690 RepID=A0A8H6YE00_9AGAR|nr:RING finger domain-containing protein [Mycena venus]
MARATRATATTRQSTRRSSRLNNQEIRNNAIVEIQQRPKRRRKPLDSSSSLLEGTSLCSSETLDKTYDHPRRSSRITPTELLRRESALELREAECKRRADELEARSLSLSKREDDARAVMQGIATRESKATLAQLEEHFTCALCVFLSCVLPLLGVILSPPPDDHALPMQACGGWHESVDCPMCRSLLVITPDRTPRLDITFPFVSRADLPFSQWPLILSSHRVQVPNRTAAAMCEAMIEKLSHSTASSSLVVKREESEGHWPGSEWDMEWGRKKGKSKEEEEMEEENADLAGWREGGNLRSEWLKKDRRVFFATLCLSYLLIFIVHREGKKEMLHLLKYWTTMRSQDFVDLKHRLGV